MGHVHVLRYDAGFYRDAVPKNVGAEKRGDDKWPTTRWRN
ncbi:hypothetical protein CCACVL1_29041 [Corchorus capsularis]|uniref:Uncharacterized protein n=1 Tax=Corchorus capsularis TaxID=210143 RepID=A0A1R3G472_COCAP|nr:hypothetical protein CCACVL1_29041 [Corchorus capsularis]